MNGPATTSTEFGPAVTRSASIASCSSAQSAAEPEIPGVSLGNDFNYRKKPTKTWTVSRISIEKFNRK